MPQTILPLIPYGATQITDFVSVWREEERWTYFWGTPPIYFYKAQNLRMFRVVNRHAFKKPFQLLHIFLSRLCAQRSLQVRSNVRECPAWIFWPERLTANLDRLKNWQVRACRFSCLQIASVHGLMQSSCKLP